MLRSVAKYISLVKGKTVRVVNNESLAARRRRKNKRKSSSSSVSDMSRRHTLSLQHVFAGERLQGYSDAVFSIIATFMVSAINRGKKLDALFLINYNGTVIGVYFFFNWLTAGCVCFSSSSSE